MLRKGVKLLIKKMVDYKKALVAILPNTPTVTGYSSYDPCACRATTPAPSAN